MKKHVIMMGLALLLSGLAVHAQSPFGIENQVKQKKVSLSLGITAGANMSALIGVTTSDPSMGLKPGFTGGAVFQIRFIPRNNRSGAETGWMAIQPEVRFTMQGGKNAQTSLNLSYLSIPVMVQFYPTKGLYVEAGPVVNINLGHSPNELQLAGKQYEITGLKAHDVMMGVGVGYLFDFGLGLGIRYNHGVLALNKSLPMRSYSIQAGVTYLFRLGKSSHRAAAIDF